MANLRNQFQTTSATLHAGTGRVCITYVDVTDKTTPLYQSFPISSLQDRAEFLGYLGYERPDGSEVLDLKTWWMDNGPLQHRELCDEHMAALNQSDADRQAIRQLAQAIIGPDPDECYSQY